MGLRSSTGHLAAGWVADFAVSEYTCAPHRVAVPRRMRIAGRLGNAPDHDPTTHSVPARRAPSNPRYAPLCALRGSSALTASASCEVTIGSHVAECVIPGWVADGDPCTLSAQCQHNECGGPKGPDRCGTCRKAFEVGSTCNGSCGKFLACVDGACVAKVPLGGACQRYECAPFSVCVDGKCSVKAQLDEVCDLLNGTAPECDFGLRCGNARVCEPITYASLGQPCPVDSSVFCSGSDCHEEVCKEPLGEGAPCDATDYERLACRRPLACVDHVCTRLSSVTCSSED